MAVLAISAVFGASSVIAQSPQDTGKPAATLAAPQAMKNFQDNWNVSYLKAMKDFKIIGTSPT
jgi:hypothetical protein